MQEEQKNNEYPSSYLHNTEREEITLAYVENVRQQFKIIFPKRRELFLTPLNECGVKVLKILIFLIINQSIFCRSLHVQQYVLLFYHFLSCIHLRVV
jgi:hypothetical protein